MIQILTNIISYRARLEKRNDSDLVKESYNDDIMLHTYGLSSWYSCTEEILKTLNYNSHIFNQSPKKLRKTVQNKLKAFYDIYHRVTINNNNRKDPNEKNKLRTYRNIKYEPYLDLDINKNLIKKYTQLRLSAHRLQIELARHIKTTKNDRHTQKLQARKCKLCLNSDEDEMHFVMQCPSYNIERTKYLTDIHLLCKNTAELNDRQLFTWVFSNEDPRIMTKTIKFINDIFEKREIILKDK